MLQYDLRWLIEQKTRMLDKILIISRELQDARKNIAKPYVYALEKRFPKEDAYSLIEKADRDLQKSNEVYRKLTEKLIELQEFNQNPFQDLVRLIKQTQL